MVPRETSPETSLRKYRDLLLKWNKRIPLVSRKDPEGALDRLLVNSTKAEEQLPTNIKTLVDIGSGGGLPGIPLAILRPQMKVKLIERSSNKCLFLRTAAIQLGLDNLEVINDGWSPAHFDATRPLAITSLGVGDYEKLVFSAWPHVQAGDGFMLFISRELAETVAKYVSCETWHWEGLKGSDKTGVAWLVRQ